MQTDYVAVDSFMRSLSARVRQLERVRYWNALLNGPLIWSLATAPTEEDMEAYRRFAKELGLVGEAVPQYTEARSLVVAASLLTDRLRVIRLRDLHEGTLVRFTNESKQTYKVHRITSTALLNLGPGFPAVHPLWVMPAVQR